MVSKIGISGPLALVLERHGFRAVDEAVAATNRSRRYENQHFAVQLFAERDGELYMKIGLLDQGGESHFLPGVLAFLHSNDDLVRDTHDIARAFDENYDGLIGMFGSQPSAAHERVRFSEWSSGFVQRESHRMRLLTESARKERAQRRRWWKLW